MNYVVTEKVLALHDGWINPEKWFAMKKIICPCGTIIAKLNKTNKQRSKRCFRCIQKRLNKHLEDVGG